MTYLAVHRLLTQSIMPKVSVSSLPVSGLFGVCKPSGPTSMALINDLKKLVAKSRLFVPEDKLGKDQKRGKRDAVKIGQGGTLDPLADGVLVIGVGKGTKKLSQFLDCEKEYQTTCLLGCETDTYDSEGARVRIAPWHHVTKEQVESALSQFTGEIEQIPPIFSALKMDGKPLYEYARKGIPLPRPIDSRKVKVLSLELAEWKGNQHHYHWPQKIFSETEKKALETALQGVEEGANVKDEIEQPPESDVSSAFVLKMKVSGGTYVRSIVHDLAHVLGSAGHVVTLTRSRQGRFVLEPTKADADDQACIPWEVFQKALVDPGEKDSDGWTEWEKRVIESLELVEH
ncbi:hypothetical protein M378DRAFT_157055 [Amanita muscaria Koide BX008]|uniref:tRNA pseudouridine(55) synthase n=1 Tax=Amanita muscaria (strain Koide BX008) TaxID=946122 RepID=A0A0C2X664_AMAMK|nr:hypothetical protein M378DRAFT_157055 [Amanita muscaria Koide BX008]